MGSGDDEGSEGNFDEEDGLLVEEGFLVDPFNEGIFVEEDGLLVDLFLFT